MILDNLLVQLACIGICSLLLLPSIHLGNFQIETDYSGVEVTIRLIHQPNVSETGNEFNQDQL